MVTKAGSDYWDAEMRIAAGVSYDGSRFDGWQSQPSRNTVQDILESALSSVADASVRAAAAGRTDARVHAAQQVVQARG